MGFGRLALVHTAAFLVALVMSLRPCSGSFGEASSVLFEISFRSEFLVTVVLVGFEPGTGLEGSLQAFLDESSRALPRSSTGLLYHVVPGRLSLEREISSAISSGSPFISQSAITDVLSAFARRSLTSAYSFFVIGPRASEGVGSHAYYASPGLTNLTFAENSRCGAVSWWGSSERVLWMDLAASAELGPRVRGGGVVSKESIPRFTEASDLTPNSASLAAIIHRTLSRIVGPLPMPLPRADHSLEHRKVLHLVKVCDREACDDVTHSSKWEAALGQLKGSIHLPQVTVREHSCPLDDNLALFFGLAHSLRTAASPTRGREAQHSISSAHLALKLKAAVDGTPCLEGVNSSEGASVAYVLDLETDQAVWLDDSQQAVVYDPRMILAVQTRARSHPQDMACNGRPVSYDPGDASCATLRALLAALFGSFPLGLAPQIDGHLSRDYLWLHETCDLEQLEFFHRDASARGGMAARLSLAVAKLEAALGDLADAGLDLDLVIEGLLNMRSSGQEVQGEGPWQLFRRAKERAAKYLAIHNYAQAAEHIEAAETHAATLARRLEVLFKGATGRAVPRYL
mmetsp:Transcript_26721/g.59785  ORF Transcript_26721/g.59785 Transcript_26721/m.59785 type:complete len:573 (-) Transcript_26721:96-1814(-)